MTGESEKINTSDSSAKNRLMKNRWYLYATGFFSGMSVMAIELGASRLMAPYFSSSQIIWTIIIGTIMIAMAIGNVWGGRLADKNPDPARLYIRLLIAAAWTAAIPFAGKYVILGVSYVVMSFAGGNYLIWASLFTCLVIFVFPLMILGMTTPSLIKYTATNLEDNGRVVGELEAFGTAGSIIGTFLPTFVTIPSVGTAMTFLIFAFVLALIALVYFICAGRHVAVSSLITGVILILLFIPKNVSFAFWENSLVYEGESIYNYLRVKEDDDSIILSTNVLEGVQSIKMKNTELTGMYYDYAMAAPLMTGKNILDEKADDDMHMLILGLGSGTYASQCMKYYHNIEIEGVEIDKKIVDLAYKYFDLPSQVDTIIEDGRAYLRDAGKYDVIMVDAYQDITIPFQMSSQEFFTMVKDHLNDGGVMVVNMNMASESEDSINDYLRDTIVSVFPEAMYAETGTNIELFAGMDKRMWRNLQDNIVSMPDGLPLKELMQKVKSSLTPIISKDRILTDDKAPVELLGMKVLDEMITNALSYVDLQLP